MTTTEPEAALALVERIKPILSGNSPGTNGAALAELVSIWVVGHAPELRGLIFQQWAALLHDLINENAKQFDPIHYALRESENEPHKH